MDYKDNFNRNIPSSYQCLCFKKLSELARITNLLGSKNYMEL